MIRLLLLVALLVSTTACPKTNATQRQQIAQAAQDASVIVGSFQKGELQTYNQGVECLKSQAQGGIQLPCIVISAEDHKFIEESIVTISTAGKTADACIRNSTTTVGATDCVSTVIATIDQINSDGGWRLKSAQAKIDFQLAMVGARTTLSVISTVLGGATK